MYTSLRRLITVLLAFATVQPLIPTTFAQGSPSPATPSYPESWTLELVVTDNQGRPSSSRRVEVFIEDLQTPAHIGWTDGDGKMRLALPDIMTVVETMASAGGAEPPSGEVMGYTAIEILSAERAGAHVTFGRASLRLHTIFRPLVEAEIDDPAEVEEIINTAVGDGVFQVPMTVYPENLLADAEESASMHSSAPSTVQPAPPEVAYESREYGLGKVLPVIRIAGLTLLVLVIGIVLTKAL